MGFKWTKTPTDTFVPGFEAYRQALHGAILRLANAYAPLITEDMQRNASWKDDTGLARASLHSEVYDLVDSIVIAFGHGVDYGQFLETVRAGSLGIVGPTLDKWSGIIWDKVEQLLG